jgi:hypothetical protein
MSTKLALIDSHTEIRYSQSNLVYAHFSGATKTKGDYKIGFQVFPFRVLYDH